MRQLFIITVLVSFLLLLCSCATIEPMKPIVKGPERLFDKNYQINRLQNANVGEEIIKVKDYWVVRSKQHKMKSLNDYTITFPSHSYSGFEGEIYEIFGTVTNDGERLYLIKLPIFANENFGITEDGKWAYYAVMDSGLRSNPIDLIPEDTRFEIVEETKIDASKTFINYEIIFTGTTANSVNFLYREYTTEDLARPAFHQSLTYPIGTEIIRFRQTRIKIHEITSESITYTVLEDGLTG